MLKLRPEMQISRGLTVISVLLLAASLLVLTSGAELLVRGAVNVARGLGVSALFIGLTIVGFGTSTPELSASLTAAFRGSGDMAVGNVVGSNICNTLLILGVVAVIYPIRVSFRVVRAEMAFCVVVSLIPFAAVLSGNTITRAQGAAMVVLLGVYLWRGYVLGRSTEPQEPDPEAGRCVGLDSRPSARVLVSLLLIAAGLALLVSGSWLLVESASDIARGLGLSELVIGLTVVAVGTSTPELITSIVAAVRKQPDVAVGNVIGSNIFNILGILGITSLAKPQQIPPGLFRLDLPLMVAAAFAAMVMMRSGSRISRPEGALALAAFVVYTACTCLLR